MTEQAVENSKPLTPEEQEAMTQQWVKEHFQKANRFLAEKGVIPSKVIAEESRYLAPFLAVWKMESKQPKPQTFWVMSGDLPSDYVDVKVAATARDAIRHFSMMWQLKAENLVKSGAVKDKTQAQFAQLLVSRAESLYQIHNDEKLWKEG
ncbi:DUF4826 family protein [Shewanella marisflavi]|uniref:DUF4826 domain-containing protein n=1 Tax=Shewanella marisflavi TaxID=260364 RepID=A0AAC9U0L5_9GAMM|nr:DUF4826 family protein [Shewanella marisflavi]ASJ97173.1 DUF4826 domain-containing protein [Shewanella marisflavi]MCL1042265.1 DUF4826 family protein [Shewanella marisflavi]